MLKYLLAILVLIIPFTCPAQIADMFPLIKKTDLPDALFSPPRVFNGTALFGYIDGGAELYLEYGFSEAVITDITYRGGKYKTEIFKMKGPAEAFGIYSVSKFNCRSMPDISDFTCQTKYQLQMCKGSFYVSIINSAGSDADQLNMVTLGSIISTKISESDIDLTGYLPGASKEDLKMNCFLARGRLGIVNGSPDLEDLFQGINGFTAVIIRHPDEKIISIKFDSESSLGNFLRLHKWDAGSLISEMTQMPDGMQVKKLGTNRIYIISH
jgi:hypothetical protein